MRKFLPLALLAFALVSLSQSARAAILVQTYNLNQSNRLPDGTAFGTVTLSLDPSNGTVTVTYSIDFTKIPNPLSNFGFQQVALNTDLRFGNGEGGGDDDGSDNGDGEGDDGNGSPEGSGDHDGEISGFQLSATNDWDVSFGFKKLDGFGQFNIVATGEGDNRQITETITISGLTGSQVSFDHFTIASLDRQGQTPNESSVFFAARIQPGNLFIGGPDLETLDVAEPDPFLLIGGGFCLLGMTCFLRKKRLHA
jgi:hypothetical protein